ncbi:MAG: hypothetical protein JXA25_13820 [Anaerolineales bacterium]|nr:hypothetical protein [Anaerolineales bacterium]
MKGSRSRFFVFLIVSLLLLSIACPLGGAQAEEGVVPSVEPTSSGAGEEETSAFVSEAQEIEEPGGAVLTVAEGALNGAADVSLEDVGEGVPFAEGSPFEAAGSEYRVDLGEAQQIGEITLTVPLDGALKQDAALVDFVYLAWTEPVEGLPSVVGVMVEDDTATMPVVGDGIYQVFALKSHQALLSITSIYDPLVVPTYPQRTSSWCSPTALTNLVQYHEGAWPVGGLGSTWGESSNWYLTGKAGQAFDHGFFFHWLLGAGGYTVPANVKQSFSNNDMEVIIWNWNAAIYTQVIVPDQIEIVSVNTAFAGALFDAFQAYVEHYLWGIYGARRPVAWGSGLAGHSRTITGSDGTNFYNNNPSSGSLNAVIAWADYRQQVLDSLTSTKVEVIDTVVLTASPRPAQKRRGVIWLLNADNNINGSVALISGEDDSAMTNWTWDGAMDHDNGYYHLDLTGTLPEDPVFGSKFQLQHAGDRIEVGYSIFNISTNPNDFQAEVILYDDGLSEVARFAEAEVSLSAGQRQPYAVMGSYPLQGLSPGLYTLKFVLEQNAIVQDVKYVQFRVSSPVIMVGPPYGLVAQNAFCRKGPGPDWDPATSFDAGTELLLVGVNEAKTWGKFEAQIGENRFQCWIALSVIENLTAEQLQPVLVTQPLPEAEPEDTQPPRVSISHSPSGAGFPKETDQVTFTATASDDTGVSKIRIWVTAPGGSSEAIKTCEGTTTCTVTSGPYTQGELTYWAKAWDEADNTAESTHTTITIFAVPR